MITKEEIKELLIENKVTLLIDEDMLDYDTELILDSLSLLLVLDSLEQRFGLKIRLEEQTFQAFSSVNSIYILLQENIES